MLTRSGLNLMKGKKKATPFGMASILLTGNRQILK